MAAAPPPGDLRVRLAGDVLVRDGGRLLAGGVPLRLVRLSAAGAEVAARWRGEGGPVGDAAGARSLARRLLDGGLLDAIPSPLAGDAWRDDVAIVVPVRDRAEQLERCLRGLSACGAREVIVVDDGSRDWSAIASVAARHGARVVAHTSSRGPGAARNTGFAATTAPLVAFVDSDVVTGPGDRWLAQLVAHFADPALGAVAPRVHALDATSRGWVAGYERRHASLDMGSSGGLVGPGRPLSYVPSATLVVRRSAMPEGGFADLPFGEDVDLCWRIAALVRYEPRAGVHHEHRIALRAFLSRRRDYAVSIGPLARRHPDALPALRADPGMALAVALLAARRPRLATLAALVCAARVHRKLGAERDPALTLLLTARGLRGTAHGLGHATRRAWSPLLLAASVRVPRARGLLALAWLLRAAEPGAPRRADDAALAIVDDLVSALGTWEGSARHRTARPLLPSFSRGR